MRRLFVTLWLGLGLAACVERGDVLGPLPAAVDTGEGEGGAEPAEMAGMGGSAPAAGSGGLAGSAVTTPTAVVAAVSLGNGHGAALSDGRIFTWGQNDHGQLGQGDTVERHTPTLLASDLRFSALASGGDFTCALDELGAVYCWGAGDRGQLGQGDRTEHHAPVRVTLPVRASSITSDFEHVCALLGNAQLYCWGRNQEGELGQNDRVPPSNDDTARDALEPVEVPGDDWSFVDAGDGHTCGIRDDGSLWCWGRNTDHQLGQGDDPQVRTPLQVGTDTDWLRVDCGQQHSIALKQDHSIWVWGLNEASNGNPPEGWPLGLDAAELDVPTELGTATDWVAVSTRVFHSCAVNRQGELWCWGRNVEGQLGTGDTTLKKTPALVASNVADVDVSWFTTCALERGGGLACTGKNEEGELGTGATDRPLRFTDITAAFR
ncbi:MAG TPA: hypothetical protein VGQ57_08545 [Polyangiaceae bacterium]|nr:hypothetical protein [Polyangiaceae bacterium]